MLALISGSGFLIVSPAAGCVCKFDEETAWVVGPLAVVAMAARASVNVFGLFASIKYRPTELSGVWIEIGCP
jgi:hypothetical protein